MATKSSRKSRSAAAPYLMSIDALENQLAIVKMQRDHLRYLVMELLKKTDEVMKELGSVRRELEGFAKNRNRT